jgi:K+-sensing histidine kinase KdpD
MAGEREPQTRSSSSLPEAAVRTLRHEVGDLLQTVYATAALLQQRLPAGWDLERRILTEMRARGEGCRRLLDVTHDLICPMTLTREPVDLAELLTPILAAAAKNHPQLQIQEALETVPRIQGDVERLDQFGSLMLVYACETAAHRVDAELSVAPNGKEVQCTLSCDGEPLTDEELQHYFTLNGRNDHAPSRFGILLARRIIQLHGGRMEVLRRPDGGCRLYSFLPAINEERN